MKYKIAVCDDDADQREYVYGIVDAWAKRNHHMAEIKQYAEAKAFLFDYAEEKDFDILLLDIEMPEISGVELARTVRQENGAVQIIFVTGYYEYFSDGFDVSALHYLMKPIDTSKLCAVLDKAVGNLAYRQRSVLLATADGDIKVSIADIIYAEAQNVYVMVHTVHGNYRSRMAFGAFCRELDETFFKTHRSFVAGLKYIRKITRTDITMSNGDTIPISRGMYDEIHTALVKYL